jgi:hypothetical protein
MQRGDVLFRAMFRAATNRLSLGLSGAVAMSALLIQSGTLGALAVGGYLMAVAIDLTRPDRWRQAMRDLRRKPPALPPIGCYSDGTVRDLLARIERARSERLLVEQSQSQLARTAAETLVERACALEGSAARLLTLLERVNRYLGSDPIAPVREEVTRMQRAADRAPPDARAEYESALRALAGRLSSLEYAVNCRTLVQAKLEALVCGLEALPPALVAIELRQSTASALIDDPPLPGLLEELSTLEEAARTVGPPVEA